jgi:hypothetical protein
VKSSMKKKKYCDPLREVVFNGPITLVCIKLSTCEEQ